MACTELDCLTPSVAADAASSTTDSKLLSLQSGIEFDYWMSFAAVQVTFLILTIGFKIYW